MKRQRLIIIPFVLLFIIVILSFLTVDSFEQVTAEKELVMDDFAEETYYLIYYDPNGGAGGSEADFGYVAPGAQYTLETWGYSYPGYTLIGWNTEFDGSGTTYSLVYHFDSYDLGKNLMLYAVWQSKSFTIKYDSNGGSGTIENVVVNYGAELIINDGLNFSKKGYHIEYWNAIYDDGVRVSIYDLSQTIKKYTLQEGMTLYAVWEENIYTITYKGNDGVSEDITGFTYYSEKYVLKGSLTFSREGYTLSGWSTKSNDDGKLFGLLEEISSYDYTSDLTLYAIWVPNTYDVIFNYHEATGNASDSGKTVTYDALYGALPSPTKINNTFQGWYTLADGGTKITSETIVQITEEQTIHAHWSMVLSEEYILTIMAIPEVGGAVTQGRICSAGVVIELTAIPALGYEFVSWSDGGLQTHSITMDGNISVTAVFRTVAEDMCTLSLSLSEGGQVIGSGTYTEGSAVSISAVPDLGYEFVSWSDGGLQTHTVVLSDDIILTVQFEKIIAEEKKSLTQRIEESESDVHLTIFNSEIESDSDAVVDNMILLPEVVDGKTIMLSVRDDNNKKLYSWTFNCETARYNEQSEYSKLDIRVRGSFTAGEIFSEDKVKSVLDKISAKGIPEKSLYMDFKASGPLPYKAFVDYLVGIEYVGEEFAVYHYNEITDTLEDTGQDCVVSADGYVTLALDHCSYYVLLSEIADAGVDGGRPYIPIIILMVTVITVIGAILLYRKGLV